MSARLPLATVLLGSLLLGGLSACGGDSAAEAPASKAPLVVMISIDTLRADHVGREMGEGARAASLTPNLDRLAREGVRFTHAYATANETRLSHASAFTGRYPSELASPEDFRIPPDVPTLPEVLSAYGWQSAAFVAGGHMAGRYGVGRGWGTWDDGPDWGSLATTGASALTWLDRKRKPTAPTLLFVHGYDPHERYLKPTPFGYAFADRDDGGRAAMAGRMFTGTAGIVGGLLTFEEGLLEHTARTRPRFVSEELRRDPELAPLSLSEADGAHLAGLYAGAVAWGDAWLGAFLAGLESRGLLEDATIVLFSDHGEALGEGGVFHHRFHLSEATLNVPLIVRLPRGTQAGRTVEDLVDLTDLLPTVSAWAGAAPPAGARGRDLNPALRGEAPVGRSQAFAEGVLRLASAATPTGRLTLSGLSTDHPRWESVAAGLPLDAPAWIREGDAREDAPARALKDSLLAWRRGLPRAPAPASPSVVKGTREGGYWSTTP